MKFKEVYKLNIDVKEAVRKRVSTRIFAIAYTPGYAMGNILLTVLGPLVVAICIH